MHVPYRGVDHRSCIGGSVCFGGSGRRSPRGDFSGYQYFRANTGLNVSGIDNVNLNGWNASATAFFHQYVGVTADFSGSYGTPSVLGTGVDTKFHTYMFGPTVRYPNSSRITPFAHALFGGGHTSASALGTSGSSTDFTWALGGGLDVGVSRQFAVRVAQADFLQTRIGGTGQNNFRYSAGVVFRF